VDGPAALTAAQRRQVVARILDWYGHNARDLPWRRSTVTPWQVMISEFMLQQTPAERVREPWRAWVDRWPSPAALASASAADVVRAWGRLGYPRRAIRLQQTARRITDEYGGDVPDRREDLLRLPGVGSYTAAAILAFAYRRREVVLDTNVRRVLARIAGGEDGPAASAGVAETERAEGFLPRDPARAAQWAVASMELGALVCIARSPRCDACPVATLCRWRRAGFPESNGSRRRRQRYHGTDRQCRGALLAVLRAHHGPVPMGELDACWPDADQRRRALASLVADGLAMAVGADRYALPS
jgi:A/G-specific adenine glycosylase